MLDAQSRSEHGTTNSRKLRAQGLCPAVVYGPGQKTLSVAVDYAALLKLMKNPGVMRHPFNLTIDKKKHDVLVKTFAKNPETQSIIHVDFYVVSQDSPIHVGVPIHFMNQDKAPGVIMEQGLVQHAMVEVEVTALPRHVPDEVVLDLEQLQMGESLRLSDIVLPKDVKLTKEVTEDYNPMVVSIAPPQKVEVEEALEEASDAEKTEETGSDESEKA